MGMGDCLRCIKYLLFVFNLIFCLIGLAIVAIGVWMILMPVNEFDLSNNSEIAKYTGIFFVVIGSIITILGFLGCCGAIFENRVLLVLFFILMLLVFLILLAAGFVLLFTTHFVGNTFEDQFADLVKKQNDSASKNTTDFFQSQWICCGAKNAERDYTEQGLPIPESCKHDEGQEYVSCTQRFEEHISRNSVKVAIAIFVTALVALLGMIFSMLLCCAVNDLA